jgi:hypothetical protein
MPGVADNMSEGLITFGEKTQNTALVGDGAVVLKQVLDAYESHVGANEKCVLAFPAMVIRPDVRTEALVGVFPTRVIAAWRKGVFKKRTESVVIDRGTITKAQWYVSRKPSTQGATMLEIVAGETHTFALPKGDAKVADLIREAIAPRA